MSNETPKRRLLTPPDAAAYINELFGLDITDRWLERTPRARKVAYYKIGGMVRFSTEHLDALLDGAFVPAEQPLNGQDLAEAPEPADDEADDSTEDEPIEDETDQEPEPEQPATPAPVSRRRTI